MRSRCGRCERREKSGENAAKLKVKNNDVDQDCVNIDQNKAGRALYIDGAKKSGNDTVGANPVTSIQSGGSTQHGLYVQSNQTTGQTTPR